MMGLVGQVGQVGQIGQSDCETIRDAFLAQPVNTLSSAAYIAAGLWLVLRAWRLPVERTGSQVAYGLALASVGVGSIAFHGPMPSSALLLHDGSIVALFAIVTAHAAGTLLGWRSARRIALAAVLTAVDALLLEVWRPVGLLVAGVIAVSGVGLEFHLFRSGRRPVGSTVIRAGVALVVLMLVAGVANVLGATSSPLCDPDSVLQGHAVWHVLTAAAFALYGVIAFPLRARQEAASR